MKKVMFVILRPRTPLSGWKCLKRFKLELGPPWESSDSGEEDSEREIDEILLRASQQYEEKSAKRLKLGLRSSYDSSDSKGDSERVIDEILLMASQQYEEQERSIGGMVDALGGTCGEDNKRGLGITETVKDDCGHDTEQIFTTCEHGAAWYGSPKSTVQVKAIRKGGVPVKTQEQNTWAGSIWHDWATY